MINVFFLAKSMKTLLLFFQEPSCQDQLFPRWWHRCQGSPGAPHSTCSREPGTFNGRKGWLALHQGPTSHSLVDTWQLCAGEGRDSPDLTGSPDLTQASCMHHQNDAGGD